jgi:hypothetical protein
MKVSHARDGGQAAELEHAGLVLATRELLHTYPAARDKSCGELREWSVKAVAVLGTIAQADQQYALSAAAQAGPR